MAFRDHAQEMRAMDPQQRLLLEVSWEALEHAGIPPSSLHGSSAGVFVGIRSTDFGHRTIVEPIDAYSGTGIVFSVAAGRISYTLGITGPCVAIDTACSSSLVAVHQACRALEGRETDLVLAAGVNAILCPRATCPSRLCGRCRRSDAARASTQPPMATCAARAVGSWSSSASPTHVVTAIASSR
jgi:acyl transferase domain-containing protein